MKVGQWAWAVVACQMIRAGLALAEDGTTSPDSAPPRLRDAEQCLVRVFGVFDGKQRVAGTGFFASQEGHILTCSKGIERATEIRVSGPALGGGAIKAREIDSNPGAGVSLLKVDLPQATPCVKIYDSVFFTPGDFAYVLGFAEGDEEGARCVRAMMLGVRNSPDRGRLIQFDRAPSETFRGGPILSRRGGALGVVTFPLQTGPSRAGWGIPVDAEAVKNLLALNHVPFQGERSLRGYVTWPFFLSFILVALLVYGGYVAVVWRTQGRGAALSRLPARTVALCLLASALAHLSVFVVVLLLQQRVEEGEGEEEFAEVAVVHADGGTSEGVPGERGQPAGEPPKVDNLPTRRHVEQVDVSKKIQEVTAEKIKEVAKKAEQSDAESKLLTQKELEGAVALAEQRARKTSQAAEDLQSNTKALRKRLAEASRGGGTGEGGEGHGRGGKGSGPGRGGGEDGHGGGSRKPPDSEPDEARRARWTLVPPEDVFRYFMFLDKHGGEIAVYSSAHPNTLFYLSNVTSAHKKVRSGSLTAETRMQWVWEGPIDPFRYEEIEAFLSVGRVVSSMDPIVNFFPRVFEEKLARLEQQYRAAKNRAGPPIRTVFRIGSDLEPQVETSD